MRNFVKTKSSLNREITLSFIDLGIPCSSHEFQTSQICLFTLFANFKNLLRKFSNLQYLDLIQVHIQSTWNLYYSNIDKHVSRCDVKSLALYPVSWLSKSVGCDFKPCRRFLGRFKTKVCTFLLNTIFCIFRSTGIHFTILWLICIQYCSPLHFQLPQKISFYLKCALNPTEIFKVMHIKV